MKPDRTLIISVFIVASCGLAYELIIAALASYLLGDSILQFSSIIGLYLFAMGIGAHLTKYIRDALVLVVGIVVGMEIPLVMRVLNRRQADFKDLVAKVLTFDYLGALAVSLLFPLVLAPRLGMARSALLFGLFNAAVAVLTARAFKAELPRYRAIQLRGGIVLACLLAAFAAANRITFLAEQSYFGDPVVYESHSPKEGTYT